MKIRKAIAYAYPSSPSAEILGMADTGAYFVQQSILREDGTWSPPYIAPGTEGDGATYPDDPDLISILRDVDGDICPHSLAHRPDWYPADCF